MAGLGAAYRYLPKMPYGCCGWPVRRWRGLPWGGGGCRGAPPGFGRLLAGSGYYSGLYQHSQGFKMTFHNVLHYKITVQVCLYAPVQHVVA